jgi:hypothetical protein
LVCRDALNPAVNFAGFYHPGQSKAGRSEQFSELSSGAIPSHIHDHGRQVGKAVWCGRRIALRKVPGHDVYDRLYASKVVARDLLLQTVAPGRVVPELKQVLVGLGPVLGPVAAR